METLSSNQTSCSTDERPGRRSPRLSTSSMGTAAEEVFDDEDLICVMRAKLSADELTGTWAFTDGGAEAGTLRYKNVQDGDERGVRVVHLRGSFSTEDQPAVSDQLQLHLRPDGTVDGRGKNRFCAYVVAGEARENGALTLRKLTGKKARAAAARVKSEAKVDAGARRREAKSKRAANGAAAAEEAEPLPPKKRRKEKRRVAPKDGDRLLIRWAEDAAGSAAGGYYRCVLSRHPESGEPFVYGRDRDAGWWDEPVSFERDEDDWKADPEFAAAPRAPEPPRTGTYKDRALAKVRRFVAALPPWRPAFDDAGDVAERKKPRGDRPAKEEKSAKLQKLTNHHSGELKALGKYVVDHVVARQPADVVAAYACDVAPPDFAAKWRAGHQLMKPLRGINIQRPWAGLILDGVKKIEARRYDVRSYADEWLWLIETPGKDVGKRVPEHMRKHRITGLVRFAARAVKYAGVGDWRGHEHLHRIPATSPFDWKPRDKSELGPDDKPDEMYGWYVAHAYRLAEPVPGPTIKGVIGCKPVPRLISGVVTEPPPNDENDGAAAERRPDMLTSSLPDMSALSRPREA